MFSAQTLLSSSKVRRAHPGGTGRATEPEPAVETPTSGSTAPSNTCRRRRATASSTLLGRLQAAWLPLAPPASRSPSAPPCSCMAPVAPHVTDGGGGVARRSVAGAPDGDVSGTGTAAGGNRGGRAAALVTAMDRRRGGCRPPHASRPRLVRMVVGPPGCSGADPAVTGGRRWGSARHAAAGLERRWPRLCRFSVTGPGH